MHALTVDTETPRRAALVATDGRTYPLERAHVEGRAEGGLALTTLRQRFRNPWSEALEVEYTLPLPADGAVLAYVVKVGERRIVGEIQTREVAEKAYLDALYQGRTAGLLEQDRADTFQQRLGNIPGGTPVEVEIRVLHPLAFLPGDGVRDADEPGLPRLEERDPGAGSGWRRGVPRGVSRWEYRFPTVVGVRYMGAPGRVPDAQGLDPDRAEGGVPARLTLDLQLVDAPAAAGVASPSHPLRVVEEDGAENGGPVGNGGAVGGAERGDLVGGRPMPKERDGKRGVRVALAEGAPLDRDLVIRWEAPAPEVGVRVVEGGGLEGDGGRYALVTVLPPGEPAATFRRDLTILLDTSGSMHGSPLALAKRVVGSLLETLEPGDRFELLAFGTHVQDLSGGIRKVSGSAVPEVLARLAAVYADGGTEMRSAVERALRPLRRNAQRQVVLVTDGYIGFEGEVVAEAMARLPEGVRFHAVGVGAAPNRTLTGGLARAGRGVELFAQDESTADEAARRLAAATSRPILTGLVVEGDAVRAVAPARPRDVLAGQPVVLTVELTPAGGRLEVRGVLAGEGAWRRGVSVPGARVATTSLPLGALHGRELVADLELKEAAGAPRAAIDRQIEAVALRHRIVSRRTSLVAVAEEPSVDPRHPRRRQRLVVELPAGVSAEGVGLWSAAPSRGFADPVFVRDAPLFAAMEEVRMARLEEPRFDAVDGPMAGAEVTATAEVIHRTPELLVVEFEVPFDGCWLPEDGVTVILEDGQRLRAEVDPGRSTQAGPWPGGVRVRLALRPGGGEAWPSSQRVTLEWRAWDV